MFILSDEMGTLINFQYKYISMKCKNDDIKTIQNYTMAYD